MHRSLILAALTAASASGPATVQTYYGRELLRKPATAEAAPQPPAGWSSGEWSQWSSACSDASTRTRAAVVADGQCASPARPSSSETATLLTGCGYAWQAGAWSAPSNTCGLGAQARAVFCRRSDGAVAGDASCAAERPAATQSSTNYSTRGYSRGAVVSYGAWSSTCSSAATRTDR